MDNFGKSNVGIKRYIGADSYKPFLDEYEFSPSQFSNHLSAIDGELKNNRDIGFSDASFLNIWIVDLKDSAGGDLLQGYGSFPFDISTIDPNKINSGIKDGVVLDYEVVNPNIANYTITHEVGHWLGLFHNFENINLGGNNAKSCNEVNSFTQGDLVYDTDPMSNDIEEIFTNIGSGDCNGYNCNKFETLDVQNFMYYLSASREHCYSFFSLGQKERMREILNEYIY